MDFFSVFKEPGVIVCLGFSFILYLFPAQGKLAGQWIISHIGGASSRIRLLLRLKNWKYKKSLLSQADNPAEVQWQILRAYSLMLMFGISITTYVLLVAVGPLGNIGDFPVSVQYFIYSPVLVLEVLWLLQRERALSLVRARGKRVTSQSIARLRRRTAKSMASPLAAGY